MLDQLYESFRKSAESSLQVQQDFFRQWTQQWMAMPSGMVGTEWGQKAQKRWLELTVEFLNRHRELIDTVYKSGIQLIEHSFGMFEAKSPEEYRRMVEELWHELFDSYKNLGERQFRELQEGTEKWFAAMQEARV
jgi:hypothetical protein